MQPEQEKYKYEYNGKELDTETGLYYYGARYYNPRISQFYATDPLAEKYYFQSPYTYATNNPVGLVDVKGLGVEENDGGYLDIYGKRIKISNVGDKEGVDFIYHFTGNNAGSTEILYNGKSVSMMRNQKNLLNYTLRNSSVNYKTITKEFLSGSGPEKSIFDSNHPMTNDLKDSYNTYLARERFLNKRKKTKGFPSFLGGTLNFMRAGFNMTDQMVGSASYAVYPLSDDKAIIFLFDSKSKESLYYHLPFVNNKQRGVSGDNRRTNTYQTYFWIENINTMKQKIEKYDIENGVID